MTKSTNKTIWTLALILILGFLVWKLWPALKNKLNGGGSGGGGVGGATAAGQYPYASPQGGQGGGLGAGLGGGLPGAGGGSTSGNVFTDWLNSVLAQGYYNASQLGNAGDLEASDAQDLYNLDEQGLPLANVPGYGDIDQFLVVQDVPGSDDGDYGPDVINDDTGDQLGGGGGGDAEFNPWS